ncbi:MAG: acyl-CoA dehydrogenase [Smithella sp.]|nr:acyl-CoA dehydrogenase [Smithella sp.]
MGNLLVNIRDQKFLLYEQFNIESLFKESKFEEYSKEVMDNVFNEAEKMAVRVIAPTRKAGDKEGCTLKDGQVFVPDCYHDASKKFSEAGWSSACADPEAGGQGMPNVLHKACCELFGSAHYAFSLYQFASSGAANLIENYGTETQKVKYMYNMRSYKWGGTQCMTESNAGSDVGALSTTAKRLPDGKFSISGTKIFISEGDHNLTPNIIHTVLARIEGDPQGTKGLSMFIVPKIRVNEDGSLGEPNDVKPLKVEEKMGFHGNGTCILSFGEEGNCIGELLGEERAGIKIMFGLINEQRLYSALHGLSHASGAYEQSVKYAKERIQSALVSKKPIPNPKPVPIIQHPDVRYTLTWMKSYLEGIRALTYLTALCTDMTAVSKQEKERAKWNGLLDLLTPVCKAFSSDRAMEICSAAMDIHGGYGYMSEYPIEQYLRDAKIACIYEGTNGIQAFDLVWRKMDRNEGEYMRILLGFIEDTIKTSKNIEKLKAFGSYLQDATLEFTQLTEQMRKWKNENDYIIPILYAKPYLTIFGDLIVGWLLMQAAEIAINKLNVIYAEAGVEKAEMKQMELAKERTDVAFYQGKVASAMFFISNVLPTVKTRCESIMRGDKSAINLNEESFGYWF